MTKDALRPVSCAPTSTEENLAQCLAIGCFLFRLQKEAALPFTRPHAIRKAGFLQPAGAGKSTATSGTRACQTPSQQRLNLLRAKDSLSSGLLVPAPQNFHHRNPGTWHRSSGTRPGKGASFWTFRWGKTVRVMQRLISLLGEAALRKSGPFRGSG